MIAILALICRSSAGEASNLAYQPTNPSFGGPVSNGPTLMGEAQAQNHFTAPAATSSIPGASQPMTQSELFASQLQSQLLSSLATQVNNAIFGANPQNSGTFTYGTQTISFNRSLSDVNISILDSATGQTTQVQVPLVQVAPSAALIPAGTK